MITKLKLAVRIVVDIATMDEKLKLFHTQSFNKLKEDIISYDYKDSRHISSGNDVSTNNLLASILERLKSFTHIPNFTDCSGSKIFEAKEYKLQVLNFNENSIDDFKIASYFITDEFFLLNKFHNKILISQYLTPLTQNYYGYSFRINTENYFIELTDNILVHEYIVTGNLDIDDYIGKNEDVLSK